MDLAARLDVIEGARATEADEVKKLRTELDDIKKTSQEREATIVEIQRRNRLRIEADPAQQRKEALEMLGEMGRRALAHELRDGCAEDVCRAAEAAGRVSEAAAPSGRRCRWPRAPPFPADHTSRMEIFNTLEEVSPLLGEVDFQSGWPAKGTFVSLTGRPTLQPKRASSDTDMTQSDASFSEFSWSTDEGYIFFPVDNWLLELSPLAFGTLLLQVSRDAFLQGLTDWLINGDGTSTYNSITGILNDTVNIVRLAGTGFASLTNANLRALMRAVLLRARRMGVFLSGPYLIDLLEEIDRTGKVPILREQGDGSYRIKSHRHVEDEGMPDETAAPPIRRSSASAVSRPWSVILAGEGMRIDTSPRGALQAQPDLLPDDGQPGRHPQAGQHLGAGEEQGELTHGTGAAMTGPPRAGLLMSRAPNRLRQRQLENKDRP